MKTFSTKRKAFTLIELLIVIAIIGILFIVLVSKVDFATDKAKATGVQTDFKSFQMAFDTVAKENAGFNTFGWDTGDANQDGIRNSYDEGDNGAGGGIAKNGVQDGTEVFTGHKVYAETFTKVYSLKKNGTGNYDRDAFNRLETAINANLDPKLHITIKDDGEIVMANGAQDPWNKEYHGWYITNAENDKKDRGAIVMYSDGANNEFGSKHTIANGIVSISIPNNNKYGKDDYGMAVIYTYINGYGEVKNITTGFSNNQSFLAGGIVNSDGTGDNVVTPQEPDVTELLEPGLYETGSNYTVKLKTWDELLQNNNFVVKDGVLKTGIIPPSDVVLPELNEYGFYYGVKYFHSDIANEQRNRSYRIFHADGTVEQYDYVLGNYGEYSGYYTSQGYATYAPGMIKHSFHNDGEFTEYEIIENGLGLKTTNSVLSYHIGSLTDYIESGDLVLPADGSITYIQERTLNYRPHVLTGIVIPNTVTNLPTFSECYNLTNVVIPNSITTIGENTFYKCSKLTNITIPNSVTSIGSNAFYRCTNLTSISIPDSVTTLGDSVFEECSALTDITLGSNITEIGMRAFDETGYYNDISNWERDVLYADDYALDCRDGNIYIKEGTRVIAGLICYSDKCIIPSSVAHINPYAFEFITGIAEIHIDKPENSISGAPWGANSWNEDVICTVYWNSAPEIPPAELEFALNADGQSYSVSGMGEYGKTDVIIPDTYKGLPVTAIGDSAFKSAKIKTVTIPSNIINIHELSFSYCNHLTNIIVDNNNIVYTSIDGVLYTKDGKTIVCYPNGREDNIFAIPTGVTNVGNYAFFNCQNINNIILPDTIENIGNGAFSRTVLASIIIPHSVRNIGDHAFEYSGFYETSILIIPEGVKNIGENAFASNYYTNKIIIPNSVESIGKKAFAGWECLSDIYINQPENSISGAPWRDTYDGMMSRATIHWNSTGPTT